MARRKAENRKNEKPVKATQAEVTKRVTQVYNWLLQGLSRADILELVAKKGEWKVSDGMIDEYMSRATAEIKEKASIQRDEELGKAIERMRFLFRQNVLIQDYKAALAVQKELNELLGLYPAKKFEHSGKDGGAINVSVDAASLKQEILDRVARFTADSGTDSAT